ncbi:MAG: SDR family oxidoreductase [Chloroflexi bacterium]|nr:SDR family oxidoreductase [Chloroflexota bacterium]
MQYVVITGVSTGIGYDATRLLLQNGFFVFGSVRKQADAERVQADFGDNFMPLLFDVTDEGGVETAVSQVQSIIGNQGLTALINNAGIATPGPLMHMPLNDFRFQLEVNVVSVLSVTQAFLPLLGAMKNASYPPGRIINISSVSGKIAYPFMGAYAASKHGLEAMSDSLRRELMLYGVDVVLIEPGTVKTPIISKFSAQVEQYSNTDYAAILDPMAAVVDEREANALPVELVSKTIYKAIMSSQPKTRYPLPRKRFSGWLMPRWLPTRWFDRLAARQLGL